MKVPFDLKSVFKNAKTKLFKGLGHAILWNFRPDVPVTELTGVSQQKTTRGNRSVITDGFQQI